MFFLTASFINHTVTPFVSGTFGGNISLTCSVSYPTSERLDESMPVFTWSTNLNDVDITTQDTSNASVTINRHLYLNAVNSKYCGLYICSVSDIYTGQPSIQAGTAVVEIGE